MQTINYSTLEADVTAWLGDWVENMREQFGEEMAEETKRDLMADPWLALKWFVEDNWRGVNVETVAV